MSERYRIETIPCNTDRVQEINDLMNNHFFPEEPFCILMGITNPPHTAFHFSITEPCARSGVSVMATDTHTGEIVGVHLGNVYKREYSLLERFKNWIWEWIIWAMYLIFATPGIRYGELVLLPLISEYTGYIPSRYFNIFNCDKILSDTFLCVSSTARGAKLGERLLAESEAVAKAAGCTHTVAVATGVFSQKVFHKLGYTMEQETPYSDIRLESGEQLPNLGKLPKIHQSAKLFTKVL
eukprot:sb/3469131/